MRHALALAERAEHEDDEIPVGAVLVSAEGEVARRRLEPQHHRARPDRARRDRGACARPGSALGNHRLLGAHAVRDAGAVRDVRDGDGACARRARGLRRQRSRRPAPPAACSTCSPTRATTTACRCRAGVLGEEAGARLTAYFRRKRGKPPSEASNASVVAQVDPVLGQLLVELLVEHAQAAAWPRAPGTAMRRTSAARRPPPAPVGSRSSR